jgi:hypothetical protein
MDFTISLFHLIHIFSAIFWVGTTLFMVGFLEPAVHAAGAAGGTVMQKLLSDTRFSLVIALSGLLTVLSGLWLYWQEVGFETAVMFSTRLPLTLGAIAGIAASFVGAAVQGRASGQMAALGQQIAAQNGPPTTTQQSQLAALQATIQRGSRLSAVLMVLAVIGMTI